MSAGKYVIHYAAYPFIGCFDGEYATDHLLPFLAHLVVLTLKYPIVDCMVRKHKRMEVRDD